MDLWRERVGAFGIGVAMTAIVALLLHACGQL